MRRLLPSLLLVLLGLASIAVLPPGRVLAAPNPVISGVSPSSGTVLGGTAVTITGSEFQPGATVFIGGMPAGSVVVDGSTRITAVTPRASVGSANVLVRNPDGGAVTMNGAYFFTAVADDLAVSGISVSSGPVRGGTSLNLTGAEFSGSTVLFGGAPATNVSVLGPSSISLRTPPGLPGPVTITVRNADGVTATLANGFAYSAGAPEIVSVTPSGGLTAGGAAVRVTGYAFAPGTRVLFGEVEARDVIVVNPTLITLTAPPLSPGTVSVRVIDPSGQSASLSNAFSARSSAAASGFIVTGVSPASGAAVGGTRVEVVGTGISGGAAVYFGAAPATVVSAPGPSTIVVNTPPGTSGSTAVTIVNSDGSSATLANAFRYDGSSGLAVSSVEPRRGSAVGGAVISVLGSGFVSGAMVSVNGAPASSVWVVGDSLAYATVPAGSGAASVTVTNPGGLSATLANAFTYEGGSGSPVTPPVPTTPPPSGAQSTLPARGFGLFVFAGGSNAQLVASVACSASTLTFWATNAAGEFDTYVPGVSIAAVNAGWNARFPNGVPANTPLIGRCQ